MSKTPKKPRKPASLHPRNLHQGRYDFEQLVTALPELEGFVRDNPKGEPTINFADPDAVKYLNKALLLQFYAIQFWDLPAGYLCPPIPGRADYIHSLADLLAQDNGGEIPQGAKVTGVDIGVGANCIYPIIGSHSYGWKFIGSDIDPVSVATAQQICSFNPPLKKQVRIVQQTNSEQFFQNVIKPQQRVSFTLCNPPFHSSAEEAARGSQRKISNLSKAEAPNASANKNSSPALNFGGTSGELWCPGGERAFIKRMIKESLVFADNCLWFTCLVSKQENLNGIYQALKNAKARKVKTIEMAQGQKQSRFVAWTFLTAEERQQWFN